MFLLQTDKFYLFELCHENTCFKYVQKHRCISAAWELCVADQRLQFLLDLVQNPEDKFSHDPGQNQIYTLFVLLKKGFVCVSLTAQQTRSNPAGQLSNYTVPGRQATSTLVSFLCLMLVTDNLLFLNQRKRENIVST